MFNCSREHFTRWAACDVMEDWTLPEYEELALLCAGPDSATGRTLQSVLERVSDQEALEACDFAFDVMDAEENALR